jgi:hypothetical protein
MAASAALFPSITRQRPVINSNTVDLNYLKTLPAGTLGREYTNFLMKYVSAIEGEVLASRNALFVLDFERI